MVPAEDVTVSKPPASTAYTFNIPSTQAWTDTQVDLHAGDVMRINVQATDPVTTRGLWAGTYNVNVTNVLAAQDSVVGLIQRGIDSVLTGTTKTGAKP